MVVLVVLVVRLVQYWLKSIRDDTYLIGRQLHNLEETSS